MKYSCLHTHSTFCDGQDAIETFCARAYEKGLVSLGFSAHAPIQKTGLQSDWHLQSDRVEAYLDALRDARRRWEGRLQVFFGLEVDYIKGRMGPGDRDFQELGLDYIIGSVHYVVPPTGAPFTVDSSPEEFEQGIRHGFAGDGEAVVAAYWDAVAAMIHERGFDILGHVDLIQKNNAQEQWFASNTPTYGLRLTQIAQALEHTDLVVELNTGGMSRYKLPEPYPSCALLQLLQEKKVPIVITADAHKAEHVDAYYDEAQEILRKVGYTHTVLFEGRKGNKPLWTQEPL